MKTTNKIYLIILFVFFLQMIILEAWTIHYDNPSIYISVGLLSLFICIVFGIVLKTIEDKHEDL